MEENSSVIIKRIPSKLTKRKFDIYIDGNRRLGIQGDETQTTLPLAPGSHTLQVFALSWIKSAQLPFTVEPNGSTTFECGYSAKRAGLFILGLFFALFAVDVVFILAHGALNEYKWIPKPFLWLGYFYLISRPGAVLYARPFTSSE